MNMKMLTLMPFLVKITIAIALFIGRYTNDKAVTTNFYVPGTNSEPEFCNVALFAFSTLVLMCVVCELMKNKNDCCLLTCCALSALVFLRAVLAPLVADIVYDGDVVTGEKAFVPMSKWGTSLWMLFVLAVLCPFLCLYIKKN